MDSGWLKEPLDRWWYRSSTRRGNFEGNNFEEKKYRDVSCAKTTASIEMEFGMRSLVGPEYHVLYADAHFVAFNEHD